MGDQRADRPPFRQSFVLAAVAVEHWLEFESWAAPVDPFTMTARQACNAVHLMLRAVTQYDDERDIDAELAELDGDGEAGPAGEDATAAMARIVAMGGEVLA